MLLLGRSGELLRKSGELPGNLWIALKKSTVIEAPGNWLGNFWGSSGKSREIFGKSECLPTSRYADSCVAELKSILSGSSCFVILARLSWFLSFLFLSLSLSLYISQREVLCIAFRLSVMSGSVSGRESVGLLGVCDLM